MRKNTHLINSHLDCSIKNKIGTADDCSIDLATSKRTTSQMCGVHRRRASRINSKTEAALGIFPARRVRGYVPWATKVKNITNSVTQNSVSVTGHTIWLRIFHISESHHTIVDSKVTNVSTDVLSRNGVEGNTTRLESLVDALEELPLLRVHNCSLSLSDSEEWWVKVVNILGDEVTSTRSQGASVGLLRVETIDIESGGRRLRVTRSLLNQHLPEFNWSIRLAGEPAGYFAMR